jgi:hypothetical protein
MARRSQLGFRYASAKLSSKHEFTQKFGLDLIVFKTYFIKDIRHFQDMRLILM